MGESLISPSVSSEELAFLGDAVYELKVRSKVVGKKRHRAKELNIEANKLSCAAFQSRAAKIVCEKFLTEAEKGIFQRGRNLAHKNYPKNISKIRYKYASALECVFGYLELTGSKKRIDELFGEIFKIYEGEKNEL